MDTFELSRSPFELRVRKFGGGVGNRHSAMAYSDGRYIFVLGAEEKAAECVDTLPDGRVIKGHGVSVGEIHDVLLSDCEHCGRAAGEYVRPGAEVRAWLQEMPPACLAFWQRQGCDGEGRILIGGDDDQAYAIECEGCTECQDSSTS